MALSPHLALTLLLAASSVSAPAASEAEASAIAARVRGLLAQQDWRSARAVAREGRSRFPGDADLRAALGEALFRAGELEALDSLLAGVDDPAPRGLMVLGRLREAQGRGGQALELMRRAVEAAPEDREILYWASGSTQTRAEAVKLLERYLALSEGDDPERIEAARGTIEVFRALGETPIWVTQERPRELAVPLRRIWDPSNGLIQGFLVRAQLGNTGKPVPLLLDSGSPGLFVIQRIARKRGFEPLAQRTTFGGGGAGRHTTIRGFFAGVQLGGLRFSAALATSGRQELDPTGRFHGVVGLSILHGYRAVLDLANDRLRLEPAADATDGAPYWTVEGQMLVRATLNGDDSGLFLFDTGSTRTIVDVATAQRLPGARVGRRTRIAAFGGDYEDARSLEGVRVGFRGARAEGSLSVVDLSRRSRLAGIEIAGFVGLDLLGRSTIVVDTVRRTVDVRPGEKD